MKKYLKGVSGELMMEKSIMDYSNIRGFNVHGDWGAHGVEESPVADLYPHHDLFNLYAKKV